MDLFELQELTGYLIDTPSAEKDGTMALAKQRYSTVFCKKAVVHSGESKTRELLNKLIQKPYEELRQSALDHLNQEQSPDTKA